MPTFFTPARPIRRRRRRLPLSAAPCPNEIQRVYLGSELSPVLFSDLEAGTLTLNLNGSGIEGFNFDATESAIQTAFDNSIVVGPGNSIVTKLSDGIEVEFIADLAGMSLPAMTVDGNTLKRKADTLDVQNTQNGAADVSVNPSNNTTTSAVTPVDEVQTVSLNGATTGTFDLSGNSASATVSSLDTSGIQSACDSIWGSGNTSVSDLGGGTFSVTFQGSFAGQDVGEMTVSSNSTDGSPGVSTSTNGVAGVNQVDTCTFDGTATAGEMLFDGFNLAYNADASGLSIMGASCSGTPASGTITTTWSDFSSHSPVSVSTNTLGITGQPQIVRIQATDSPTEGEVSANFNGNFSTWAYDNSSPTPPTGFSLTSGATNDWTFTANSNTSNVSCSADDSSTPLRKSCDIEIVTEQDGGCGGGDVTASVPAGSLVLAGVFPDISLAAPVPPGSISYAGIAPAGSLSSSVVAGEIFFAGTSPVGGVSVAVAAGESTFLGVAPAASNSILIQPVSITHTGAEPVGSLTASVGTSEIAFAGESPAGNQSAEATTGSLAFAGVAAVGSLAASLSPGAIAFVGVAATGVQSITASPGEIAFAGVAPVASLSAAVAVGEIAFTGGEPTGNQAAAVSVGAVSFAGEAPVTSNQVLVSPGGITFVGGDLGAGSVASVPAGAVDFAGTSPTGSVESAVPPGSLLMSGVTPTAAMAADAGIGQLAFSGQSPVTNRAVEVPAGSIEFTGLSASTIAAVDVPVGSLIFTGIAPVVALSAAVPAGTITFAGAALVEAAPSTGTLNGCVALGTTVHGAVEIGPVWTGQLVISPTFAGAVEIN